jgi:hypothetical protein
MVAVSVILLTVTPRNPDDRAATMPPVTMPKGEGRALESVVLVITCLTWEDAHHFQSSLSGQNQTHKFTGAKRKPEVQSDQALLLCSFTDNKTEAQRFLITELYVSAHLIPTSASGPITPELHKLGNQAERSQKFCPGLWLSVPMTYVNAGEGGGI